MELVLAGAQPDAPEPWTVDETGTRWSIERSDDLGYDPAERAYHFAPFPTLASVGYTTAGEHWLLDLERIGAMSLSGDPERCLNLARFLAAELAHNAWSEMLQVTLVGFGKEMADINPERLTYTEDFDKAIASLNGELASTADALRHAGVDVLAGRLHNIAGDAWAPHVLLIAPSAAEDTEGLDQLLTAMRTHSSRTATALVLIDDPHHADATRWQLSIDEHGTLRIPALDVELIAQQIPAEEAAQLAQMLGLAATTEDRPVPDAAGDKPWDEYSDAAGNLRHSQAVSATTTHPAPVPDAARGTEQGSADIPAAHAAGDQAGSALSDPTSVLPLSLDTYLDQTATTQADLDALAPHVDQATRAQVESIDPELDRDLAAWHDPACTQPKVRLLGPVTRDRARVAAAAQPPAAVEHRDRGLPRHPAQRSVSRDLRHRPLARRPQHRQQDQGPAVHLHRAPMARHQPANRTRAPPERSRRRAAQSIPPRGCSRRRRTVPPAAATRHRPRSRRHRRPAGRARPGRRCAVH